MRLALALLVASAVLVAAPSQASPPRALSEGERDGPFDVGGRPVYGVHQDLMYVSSASRVRLVRVARALGARISRSSLLWRSIERVEGKRNWSASDSTVNGLVGAGIEPLMVIVGSPRWANGSVDPFVVPASETAFKRWTQNYREFVRAAVQRYRERVDHWEVWNEPNEGHFWKPKPRGAARYTKFYSAIRREILALDPAAKVAVGGLAGLVESCCVSGETFLRQMIAAGAHIDNVAVHAYSAHAPDVHVPWDANFDDIQAIRDLLDGLGMSGVRLWLTEWGWPSPPLDPATQATYVQRSLELLRDRFSYVDVATYFLDVDRPGSYEHGLYDSSLVVKPSGRAFVAFMTASRSATRR